MECVRASFAPGTEAAAARSALERATRSVDRLEFCMDFFTFAEVPIEDAEVSEDFIEDASEEAGQSEPSESLADNDEESAEASEGLTDRDITSLTVAESPFFCVLLHPDRDGKAWAALTEAAARENAPMRLEPLTPEEAEDFYREALQVCAGQASALPELAAAREHLGLLLSDTERKAEAETLYRSALDGYRELSARRGGMDEAIAGASYRLGRLLSDAGRLKEAEKAYCEALDIYRELSRRNVSFQASLARTCRDLGMCLEAAGRPEAAEWFYRSALDSYRKLAERNPAAYAPRVAAVCGAVAGLLRNAGRMAEAAGLYRAALETYVRLVRDDPARWEPELAFLYENLAAFESARSPATGKALLQSAWTLYQKYPDLAGEAERVRAQIRELS